MGDADVAANVRRLAINKSSLRTKRMNLRVMLNSQHPKSRRYYLVSRTARMSIKMRLGIHSTSAMQSVR